MREREAEDDDVEPIPGIAQVRELVEDEAARQRFYRGLHRVDDREGRPARAGLADSAAEYSSNSDASREYSEQVRTRRRTACRAAS